jgi:hypothetical protein
LPDPRHFAIPFRFERTRDGRAHAATTLQGSEAEIADCVELVVRTRAGERSTLPGFGRPDRLEFSPSAELARSQLQLAIEDAEPRARPIVEGDFDPTDPAVMRLRAMFELTEAGVT